MPTTYHSRFDKIARDLKPHLDDAVEQVANAIAVDAKFRVPVDTGRLQQAIHVRREGAAKYRVLAGDHEAFYGHFLEFGTVKMTPRPFLVPALERARPSLESIVRNELKDL